jgi:hypothetical protein
MNYWNKNKVAWLFLMKKNPEVRISCRSIQVGLGAAAFRNLTSFLNDYICVFTRAKNLNSKCIDIYSRFVVHS